MDLDFACRKNPCLRTGWSILRSQSDHRGRFGGERGEREGDGDSLGATSPSSASNSSFSACFSEGESGPPRERICEDPRAEGVKFDTEIAGR